MNIETVNELIASLESAGELSIREQKFLKLAIAYVQLAAENMSMIRLLTDISDNHVEYFSEGEGTMFAGVPLDYVSEINMYVSRDVNAENPVPATDRIYAGIKADGVEEMASTYRGFANKDGCSVNMKCSYNLTAERAESYAAYIRHQMREGADK
ncbi:MULTISPECIES: hypothetical protein [Klebsiella pneumoniae complex]|uniref:hypothetical protein n=1 Tax=Klebsiella pneumoniae complex TaxID=3390273 RepID=UPI000A26B6B4|nr:MULTISPECIES: hypothetical protein [Klebsiella]HCM7776822.1 hypothetical protein [Klebsiella quasipneumoniae subsp. similipneumoniae]EKU9049665.1 hypothetical protein [Klebsiella pneumoniae]MBK2471152.1 hypothetical protein [Klebsiella quasipneumoniae]MBR7469210.1 hypothetical protein [Klebsiella quasipneumoniae]MCM2205544.1 hypothetical protein [Klebsiella quasipneumoniae]